MANQSLQDLGITDPDVLAAIQGSATAPVASAPANRSATATPAPAPSAFEKATAPVVSAISKAAAPVVSAFSRPATPVASTPAPAPTREPAPIASTHTDSSLSDLGITDPDVLAAINSPVAQPKTKTTPISVKAPTVPEKLDFMQMMSMAKDNFVPDVKSVATGVAGAIIHPIDTGMALLSIGKAIKSKIDGANGVNQDHNEKAETEAPLDALMATYKDHYKDIPSAMSYFAHHPAGVLADLSVILSGGELAAAKTGSIVGKVGNVASRVGAETVGSGISKVGEAIQTTGKVAGKVGTNINPLNPLGVFTPSSSVIPGYRKSIIDSSGNLNSKVDAAIKSQFGPMGISAETFHADPAAKEILVDTLKTKGVNPASIREGVLKSLGLKTPTSVITGAAPASAEARALSDKAIASNANDIGIHAGKFGSSASDTGIGEHLEHAYVDSKNNYTSLYNDIRNTEGAFNPSEVGGQDLQDLIHSNLNRSGLTSNPKLFKINNLPKTSEAHNLINGVLNQGQRVLTQGGDLTAPEILRTRQILNGLANDATGSDIKGVRDIANAFDQHIADRASKGHFIAPDGTPNTLLADQIKSASNAYKTHMNTFETGTGQNNNIVAAVKKIKASVDPLEDGSGYVTGTGSSDVHQAAQASLDKDLMHPTKGGLTHSQLVKTMGGEGTEGANAVNESVKASLMRTQNGVLSPPKNLHELLQNPNSVAHRAFTPSELQEARRIHAAHEVNSTRLKSGVEKNSLIRNSVGPIAARALFTAMGAEAHGFTGALAGAALEHGLETAFSSRAARKALQGAPKKGGLIGKATRIAQSAITPKKVAIANALKQIKNDSGQSSDEDEYINNLLAHESGGDPNIKNSFEGETASGLGQFTDSTWVSQIKKNFPDLAQGKSREEILAMKTDPNLQRQAILAFAKDNAVELERQGIPVNNVTKFGAHWFGAAGFPRLYEAYTANPDAPIESVFPKEIINGKGETVPSNIIAHNRLEGKTVGQVMQMISDAMPTKKLTASNQASDGRIERASGGKVNDSHHEMLVNRLMNMAKKAKKATDKTTEPLLNAPDEHIVKALDVAQQAI